MVKITSIKRAHNFIDLTGRTFDRWTVFYRGPNGSYGQTRWVCFCSCGTRSIVAVGNLRNGTSKSCGCLTKEVMSQIKKTHGLRHSPEWRIWSHMLDRCRNPKCEKYHCYGGRGIKVCERWHKFENFYTDMGSRPSPEYTLERKLNNSNYCPENCCWATWKEQRRNKRTNHLLVYNGVTKPLVEWGEESIVGYKTFKNRIKDGWNIERALNEPLKKR